MPFFHPSTILKEKPSSSPYKSRPLWKQGRVPFSSCDSFESLILLWGINNFNINLFDYWNFTCVVVRIISTNNHIKFLTQRSVDLACMMDTLPTITLMEWNISKLRNVSFPIKFLCKCKFSNLQTFFNKLTFQNLSIFLWE